MPIQRGEYPPTGKPCFIEAEEAVKWMYLHPNQYHVIFVQKLPDDFAQAKAEIMRQVAAHPGKIILFWDWPG